MALAVAVLGAACSDRVLQLPIQADDQSLLLIQDGPTGRSARACAVDGGCVDQALGREGWRILVILYPTPLAALGLNPGVVPLLPTSDPTGQPLPTSNRAFAADADDPELRSIAVEEAALYRESRYDPFGPCPSWYLRWSARAGSSDEIIDAVSMDDRTVWVFAANGEVVRVQEGSEGPQVLNQTQPVLAATRGGDGTPYVLAQDQRIYALTPEATLAPLPIPALPQRIDLPRDRQVSLAADGPGSVYVQIVVSASMGAQISTVWHFDGARWSIPFPPDPETPPRLGQSSTPEALIRGLEGEALSTKLPVAPLSYLTKDHGLIRVREVLDATQVFQIRRLIDDQILVVGRLQSEEGRIQVGTLRGGGEITWTLTVPLIGNAQWRCSESRRRGFLCFSGEGDATFIGGPERCREVVPPWVKGTRRTHPMGEGWLLEVRDNITGIESLHLLSLR